MPDLSAEFFIPNAFGLRAADFKFDLHGYRVALGFLSDLATGSPEREALEANGGNPAMLTSWRGNEKFRRVYGKCQLAGKQEREEATRRAETAPAATEEAGQGNPSDQRFIPLSEAPVVRGVFVDTPDPSMWGAV